MEEEEKLLVTVPAEAKAEKNNKRTRIKRNFCPKLST